MVWAVAEEIGWIVAVAVIALRWKDVRIDCIKIGARISLLLGVCCVWGLDRIHGVSHDMY